MLCLDEFGKIVLYVIETIQLCLQSHLFMVFCYLYCTICEERRFLIAECKVMYRADCNHIFHEESIAAINIIICK